MRGFIVYLRDAVVNAGHADFGEHAHTHTRARAHTFCTARARSRVTFKPEDPLLGKTTTPYPLPLSWFSHLVVVVVLHAVWRRVQYLWDEARVEIATKRFTDPGVTRYAFRRVRARPRVETDSDRTPGRTRAIGLQRCTSGDRNGWGGCCLFDVERLTMDSKRHCAFTDKLQNAARGIGFVSFPLNPKFSHGTHQNVEFDYE